MHVYYSQIDIVNLGIRANGRHLDVTLLVAFDQAVPALVALFTDASREIFAAHQTIETAARETRTESLREYITVL